MTLKSKNQKKSVLYCIQWSSKKGSTQFHKGPPLYKNPNAAGKQIPLTDMEAVAVAANANKHFTGSVHKAVRYKQPKTVALFPSPSLAQ
jgi:hypothetical protein